MEEELAELDKEYLKLIYENIQRSHDSELAHEWEAAATMDLVRAYHIERKKIDIKYK